MSKKHGGKKAPKQQFTVDIDGIRAFGSGLRVDFDGMTIVVDPKKLSKLVDAFTRLGLQEFITETSILAEIYANTKDVKPAKDIAYAEEDVIGWIRNTLMDIATRNAGEIKGAILVTDFFDALGFSPEPDVLKNMRQQLNEDVEPRADDIPESAGLAFSSPGPKPEPEPTVEDLAKEQRIAKGIQEGKVQPDLSAIRDEINAGKLEEPHPASHPIDVTIVHFHGLPRDVMPLMPIF